MPVSSTSPLWLVVMGVSGCGKSSLAQQLSTQLGVPLIEGDDFHPEANIRKMRDGVALTDADREGWLTVLGAALAAHPAGAVLTCSALKKAYRDRLRAAVPRLRFVYLHIDYQEALDRVRARAGAHFFSASLVDNQFLTLEPPTGEPDVIEVPATQPLPVLGQHIQAWLRD